MARLSLIVAALGLGAMSVSALAQGSLNDQLAVCARISKKDARLECYDSVSRATSQGAPTGIGASSPPAPQSAPTSTPAAPPAARAAPGFGAEQIARPVERKADEGENELSMAVISSRDNGLSMWQFALADGAVWRMTERNTMFRPPAPNESVTIRKGALGSYLMQVGSQAAVRVVRVR